MYGDNGNDKLFGEEGTDAIDGGLGNDVLVGGAGNDDLDGGDGKDEYVFTGLGLGHDTISDNTKDNTLDFSGFGSGIQLLDIAKVDKQVVSKGNLELTLTRSTAIQTVYGSDYADVIKGNSLDNTLVGRGR